MAEHSPPQIPTLKSQQAVKEKGSRLPPTSRFPVLVSGQVSFSTAAAVKDLDHVPKNVYRIQVELQPRTNDSTFKEAPWTLVTRHFLSTIQLYDDTAIIIRKKENAVANKISSPDELPENPDDFERDYAYDVKLKNAKSISFKIIIGTKLPFWQTFKRDGPLFAKLVANEWYINYVRLENQGTVAAIGHLLYAHNRYVNQDDVIKEIKSLIHPTTCEQIDVRVTKSKEYYYDGDKKVRVFTKWLTIDCPVDIATELSTLIMERWKSLKIEPKFINFNLKNTVYIPKNRGLINFDARIENIGKQNEFLRTYKDVTVIANIENIDAAFTYTDAMGRIFEDRHQVGHVLDLRAFLRTWKDNSTGNPAIIAIYRTNKEKEFSLLSGNVNMPSIHTKIRAFVNELKTQQAFKGIRVGGTRGTLNKQNYSTTIEKYTKENFATTKKYQQKPQRELITGYNNNDRKQKDENENKWKSPPLTDRRKVKGTKAALTVNFNDQRIIQEYKDVVVGNTYSNNNQGIHTGNTNKAPPVGNKQGLNENQQNSNTITVHEGTQAGTIINQQERKINSQHTIQQILESKQFQDTLAKVVAPQVAQQVSSLVAPTLEKITHIEDQVGELNDYVKGNKNWQDDQTTRQSNIQNTMNQMQSSMTALLHMFTEEKDKEGGNKRPAPSKQTEPMNSPTRKQKINRVPLMSDNSSGTNTQFNYTQYDDEASDPQHQSQHTFTENSDEEDMNPSYALSEGEGQ